MRIRDHWRNNELLHMIFYALLVMVVLCKGRKLNGAVLAPAPPRGDLLRNRQILSIPGLLQISPHDNINETQSHHPSLQHLLQCYSIVYNYFYIRFGILGERRPLSVYFTI